jgi:hypothetical protein
MSSRGMLFVKLFYLKGDAMKNSTKIILTIAAAAATGCVIYAVSRHKTNRKSVKVAEEGYETAHDILFPRKPKKRKKMQFGR